MPSQNKDGYTYEDNHVSHNQTTYSDVPGSATNEPYEGKVKNGSQPSNLKGQGNNNDNYYYNNNNNNNNNNDNTYTGVPIETSNGQNCGQKNNNNHYQYNNNNNNNNNNNGNMDTFHTTQGPPRQTADTFDYAHFKKRPGEFTFDLMTCTRYGSGFCCEAYCCYYCNLARQCGIGSGDQFARESSTCVGIGMCVGDWWLVGFTCMPFCCGGPVSWIVNCMTRQKTRDRFGIKGDGCSDCCAGVCCAWCVVQQTLGEYYVWGYNPPTGCNTYGEESRYPTPQIKASRMT